MKCFDNGRDDDDEGYHREVNPDLQVTVFDSRETAKSKINFDSVRPFKPSHNSLEEKREESIRDYRDANMQNSTSLEERSESSPERSEVPRRNSSKNGSRDTIPIPKLPPSRLESHKERGDKEKASRKANKSKGAEKRAIKSDLLANDSHGKKSNVASIRSENSPRNDESYSSHKYLRAYHAARNATIQVPIPSTTESSDNLAESPADSVRSPKGNSAKKWIPSLFKQKKVPLDVSPSVMPPIVVMESFEPQANVRAIHDVAKQAGILQTSTIEEIQAQPSFEAQILESPTITVEDVEADLNNFEFNAIEAKMEEDINRGFTSRLKARSLLVAAETVSTKNNTKRGKLIRNAYFHAREAQRIFEKVKKARDKYQANKGKRGSNRNKYVVLPQSPDLSLDNTFTKCASQEDLRRRLHEISLFSDEDMTHVALEIDDIQHLSSDAFDRLAAETNYVLNTMTIFHTISTDDELNKPSRCEMSTVSEESIDARSIWDMDASIESRKHIISDLDDLLEEGITCGGFCTRLLEGEDEIRDVPYKVYCSAPDADFEKQHNSTVEMEGIVIGPSHSNNFEINSPGPDLESTGSDVSMLSTNKEQGFFETGSLAGSDISAGAGSTKVSPWQFLYFCCGDPCDGVSA